MRVFITDTTLREGIQSPSLEMSYSQREELFYLLASVGIEEIEAGVPAHSEEEKEFLKRLTKSIFSEKIIVWNRANFMDLEASLQCGVKKVEIAFPISDIMIEKKLRKSKNFLVGLASELISYAKANNLYVSAGLEDASRSDADFLYKFVKSIKEIGTDRIRISDTVGILNPIQTKKLIENFSDFVDVEVHFHNDFGMATANAIVAALSGAKYINATLLGLGERCGITPLEEITYYLEIIQNIKTGINIKKLHEILKHFINIAKININPNKPLIGNNALTNKSSIHIDGLSKSKDTYLPFDPKILDEEAKFVFGKYSKAEIYKNRYK
ncbi:MAG: homocitrate synthase [Nitrososphaeria archaeon]